MKTTIFPKALVALTVLAAALTSCDKDVFDPSEKEGGAYKSALYSPLPVTLAANENLSEYVKALRYSGTYDALNESSNNVTYTVLAPTNEAMTEFYASRGVSSLEELTPEYVREFVKCHTRNDSLSVEDFIKINNDATRREDRFENLQEDLVRVDIDPDHAGQALLNGTVRVIEMGIPASNGTIYIISGTLIPLVETANDRINEAGNSSIMQQAIEATGWKKELDVIADTTIVSGKKDIRKRFYTLFNVTDEVFAKDGITSFEALKTRLAADDHRGVGVDSMLREYVAYHIMKNEYTLADLAGAEGETSSRLLGSNAKNQIMSIDYDGTSADALESRFTFNAQGASAGFVEGGCDIRTRNGYVHNLTSWLPVWEPLQSEVIWDLADYASVKAVVLAEGRVYAPSVAVDKDDKLSLGSKTDYIYTVGEGGKGSTSYSEGVSYVLPKTVRIPSTADPNIVKGDGYRNDYIVFNVGYMGTVKVKTPVLVKGKYRVELCYVYATGLNFVRQQNSGSNGGLLSIQIDDRADINADALPEEIVAKDFFSPYKEIASSTAGYYTTSLFSEITFDETSEHVFQMTVMDPAASSSTSFYLAFDYIKFIPID